MNRTILVGNLVSDPTISTTTSGISLCKFSIAVQRRFSKEKEADFFNVIVWKGPGENCHKFLHKGSKAGIVGSLQTRTYDDKDGVKRYVTEIIADEVEFLSAKNNSESDSTDKAKDEPINSGKTEKQPALKPIDDDDLPF